MKYYRFSGLNKFNNSMIIYSNWYHCSESLRLVINRKSWLEAIAINVNIEYKEERKQNETN